MDGLDNLRSALAAMAEADLAALQKRTEAGPQDSVQLLAYITHACGWELARRHGQPFALHGPHAVIGPDELDAAFVTLCALAVIFEHNEHVRDFLRAVDEALQSYPPGRPIASRSGVHRL